MTQTVRIYLVSDSSRMLDLLERQLNNLEEELIRTQLDALVEQQPPDLALVVVDLLGETVNCFEVLKEFRRKNNPQIPILFLVNPALQVRCYNQLSELGRVDFLSKPFYGQVLKCRVALFRDLHKKNNELEKQRHDLKRSLDAQCELSDSLINSYSDLKESKDQLEMANLQLEISCSELDRLNRVFQSFVPKQFINRIQSASFEAGMFDEEKLTILFSDIRSYSQIAENLNLEDNFEFLNTYFNLMEPVIGKQEGFIDKFIGDAIMALFDQPSMSQQAVQAAIEMQQEIDKYNLNQRPEKFPEIHFGIGINTGPVLVGALGSHTRFSSTVIGDHVNVAARLEELTKKYRCRLLISEFTYRELDPNQFLCRQIDTVKVRGKSTPITIYDCFSGDHETIKEKKLKTRDLMLEGIQFFNQRQFHKAEATLARCVELYPEDVATIQYLNRTRYFIKFPPEEKTGWNIEEYDSLRLIENSNRRRMNRHELSTPADIYLANVKTHVAGIVHNISAHGLRLELGHCVPVGEILSLDVYLQQNNLEQFIEHDYISFICQIVWHKKRGDEHQKVSYIHGLHFVSMNTEQRQRLEKALQAVNDQIIQIAV